MSRALFTHDRQHSLAHSNGAEEIRFKLHPKLVERDVFNESGHREAGIIHQHIDPAVVAHNSIDTFRDPFKLSHPALAHQCFLRRSPWPLLLPTSRAVPGPASSPLPGIRPAPVRPSSEVQIRSTLP